MCVCFFSFYYIRKKMTVITNKHCLQKLLIAPLWDDVNPVFDHRPRAIFQIFLHYKKKKKQPTLMWEKKSICGALITDYYNPMNKHLSCQLLHYEPPSSWLRSHLKSPRVLLSVSRGNLCRWHPSNLSGAAQRASCEPPSLRCAQFFNAPSGLHKASWETSLRVIVSLPRDAERLIQGRRTRGWRCNRRGFGRAKSHVNKKRGFKNRWGIFLQKSNTVKMITSSKRIWLCPFRNMLTDMKIRGSSKGKICEKNVDFPTKRGVGHIQ